jgi:hypothetical protein
MGAIVMKRAWVLSAALAGVALAGTASADGPLKSGPQVGENIPGAFHPLNVTGDAAGRRQCLVCKHGLSPVAMVFAREVSPGLVTLMKRLDEVTGKYADCEMGSFVVFLNNDEELPGELKALARQESLKHLVLATDAPAGPQDYTVAKGADVTVVLYTKHTVKANHSFRKGELTPRAIDQVVADVAKILPPGKAGK